MSNLLIFGHLGCAPYGLTRALAKAAKTINLTVHDHFIVSRQGYFSLAEHNMI